MTAKFLRLTKKENQKPLSLIFTSALIWLLYFNFFSLSTSTEKFHLFIPVTIILCISLILYFKRKKSDVLYISLILSSVFIIIILWNTYFLHFIKSTDYNHGIFRNSFRTFQAPVYGFFQQSLKLSITWLICAAIMIYFIINLAPKIKYTFLAVALSFTMLLLIISFDQITQLKNIPLHDTHYDTFREGIVFFSNIPEMMKHYVDQMEKLGEHNNHYPPGNLLLMIIEQNLFAGFVKYIVFAGVALMLLPLFSLAKVMKTDHQSALLIAATTPQLIIFPGNSIDPFFAFLSVGGVLFLVRFTIYKKFKHAAYFGLIISSLTIFSFISGLFILFALIWLLLMYINREILFKSIVTFLSVSLFIFILFYLIIYFLTEFNIIDCFVKAVKINYRQMSPVEDDWKGYLLRSTGNIISYVFVLGAPLLLLIMKRIKYSLTHKLNETSTFTLALVTTILLAAFSGLFYLETERIWILFTPLIIISAASMLNKKTEGSKRLSFFIVLLQLVTISVALNWVWYV